MAKKRVNYQKAADIMQKKAADIMTKAGVTKTDLQGQRNRIEQAQRTFEPPMPGNYYDEKAWLGLVRDRLQRAAGPDMSKAVAKKLFGQAGVGVDSLKAMHGRIQQQRNAEAQRVFGQAGVGADVLAKQRDALKAEIEARKAKEAELNAPYDPANPAPYMDMLAGAQERANIPASGMMGITQPYQQGAYGSFAPGLYTVTDTYQEAGGATPPASYDDLVRGWYENAPEGLLMDYQAIEERGGWNQLTPQEAQQLLDPAQYKPGEDVSAWEWIFDPTYRQASENAYMAQMNDAQVARVHGVFDTPANLIGGNIEYVSDDYLLQMQQALPFMVVGEGANKFAKDFVWNNNRGQEERANIAIDNAMMRYGNDPMISGIYQSDEYLAGGAEYGKYFDATTGGAYGEKVDILIELDNGINGTNHDRSYLTTMTDDERGNELRRLVLQYGHYVLEGNSYTQGPRYNPYPYGEVLEMVNTEIDAREVSTGYIEPMLADPDSYQYIDYRQTTPIDYNLMASDPYGRTEKPPLYDAINQGTKYGDDIDLALMTEIERATYNYYYNTGRQDIANEYFYSLQPVLRRRTRTMTKVTWEELATDNVFTGSLMWAGTVGANLLNAVMTPFEFIADVTGNGDDMPNIIADYSQYTRQVQEEALADADWFGVEILGKNIPQWLYTTGSSVADMGAAYLVGGGAGNLLGIGGTAASKIPLGIMAAEAAAADYASTAGQGMNPWERGGRAIATGALEWATEKLPFEAFTSNPLSAGYIMRNFFSEAAEEGVSEIGGIAIDELASFAFGHESELQKEYDHLRVMGVKNPGAVLFASVVERVGGAAFGGGLAGMGMGGIGTAGAYAQYTPTGRQVQQAGGTDNLLQLGLAMGEGTQSHQQAVQLSQQMTGSQGKARISPAQLGQLYRTMLSETNEEYKDDVRQMAVEAIGDAIADKYDTLDLVDEMEEDYTNEELGEAILQAGETGRDPGGRIGRFIKNHRVTAEILREFREGNAEWAQRLAEQRTEAGLQMADRVNRISQTARTQGTEATPTTQAVQDTTGKRVEKLTRRSSTRELLSRSIVMPADDGTEVKADIKRVERNGNDLRLIVMQGNKEVAVRLDDVRQVNGAGTARVLAFASERPEVTAEEINGMINLLMDSGEGAIKSAELIAAYETGVNAGYVGEDLQAAMDKAAKATGLATDAFRAAVLAGHTVGGQQAQADETRRRQARTTSHGGRVTYMGEVDADWDGKDTGVRMPDISSVEDELTDQQKSAAEAIGMIAEAVGVDVVLYRTRAQEGQQVTAANGIFDENGTIFVDLSSGLERGGQEVVDYTIVRTMGHELTHYIERNSKDGYAKLREMVQKTIGKNGGDYSALVINKIRESEHAKTRAQAEAELIADACDMMLNDTQAIRELAQTDKKLFTRIREFVASFVSKIRKAFEGLTVGTTESALVMEMKDGVLAYAEGLQAAWDEALIEASGNVRRAAEAAREAAQEVVKVTVSEKVPEASMQAMAGQVAQAAAEAATQAAAEIQQAVREGAVEAQDEILQGVTAAATEAAQSVYQGTDEAVQNALQNVAEAAAEAAVEATVEEKAVEEAKNTAEQADEKRQYAENGQTEEQLEGGVMVDAGSDSAYQAFSERTWWGSDYIKRRNEMAETLSKRLKVTPEEAAKWIDDVTNVANIIASDRNRYGYVASRFGSPFRSNPEYGGTIDFSTLCPKRALATGTLDAIQNALGNAAMDRNDFLRIRKMMKEKGYEVACGLCFVESSRANMSKYVEEFVEKYNRKHKGANITMPMLNTVEGLENLRETQYEVYEEFEGFMNKLAQRKPKLFEKRTEYTDEILRAFIKDTTVREKNRMGGLRIQSFSDFEIIHLIDMMQVIMDMSTVGLAGQAYTKQADFAWALGDTGLKINLSLIAKGVDKEGNLIFDPVEGMKPEVARELRERYSKNVGTVVVVFTTEQLYAAMKNDFVDFIIPFHRSQWTKADYNDLGLDAKTRDFTLHQNERHRWQDAQGKWHTTKVEEGNYYPSRYWDYKLSGKENAQRYLDLCYEEGRIPKFPFLLNKDSDGRYSMKKDGSTDGYWKLLIDFKMYDNDGNGSPQEPVRPDFNMDQAYRMLEEYKGGHEGFPVAQDIVDKFVKDWRKTHGVESKAGERVKLSTGNVQYSERRIKTPDLRRVLGRMEIDDSMNETEKALLNRYKADVAEYERLQGEIDEQVKVISGNPEKDEEVKARNRMGVLKSQQRRVNGRLRKAESSEGFARLIAQSHAMVRTFLRSGSLAEATADVTRELEEVGRKLTALTEQQGRISEQDMQRTLSSLFDPKALDAAARELKDSYVSRMTLKELRNRIIILQSTLMSGTETAGADALKMAEQLARDLTRTGVREENQTLDILRNYLGSFALTETQKQEIKNRGLTLREYKAVVGKVAKVVEGRGVELGAYIANDGSENGEGHGLQALFEGYENEGDAAMRLYDLVKEALETTEDPFKGAYGKEALEYATIDVLSISTKARLIDAGTDTVRSVLDALIANAEQDEQLREKVIELQKQLDRAAKRGKGITQRAEDIADKPQEIARYYRRLEQQRRLMEQQDALAKMQKELQEQNKSQMQEWYREKELRETNRSHLGAIRRMVGWMDVRIRKEQDRKAIPEGLKPVVEEMVRIFADANDLMHILPEKDMRDIRRVYTALAKIDGSDTHQVDGLVQEDMTQALQDLRAEIAAYESTVKGMGHIEKLARRSEILSGMKDLVGEIWQAVNKVNQLLLDGQEVQLDVVGAEMASQLEAMEDYSVRDDAIGKTGQAINKMMRDGNTTPVYFFRRLGVDVLTRLNNALLHAQERHAMMYAEAKAKMAEIRAKYDYWAWKNAEPLVMTTWQGRTDGREDVQTQHTLQLTPDEALAIWVTWRREMMSTELYTSTHLAQGGFHLAGGERVVGKRSYADSRPHKLRAEDIQTIEEYLTPQMKGYADEVVQYMSTEMAEVGNRTSMRLFGIRKFKENYYFPMKVARGQLNQKSDAGAKGDVDANRIAHTSMTKRRLHLAKKPLVIGSFTQVAEDHVEKMLLYDTFAEPIEAFNKVLNHVYTNDEDETPVSRMTLRALIEQKFGKDALQYLERYLADVNGGPQIDNVEKSLVSRGLSAYKKAAVAAKLSVVLQQPTSVIRAMMVIDPKYFLPMGKKGSNVKLRNEWGQLTQYSGVALIKERGGFDMMARASLGAQLAGDATEGFDIWRRAQALIGVGTPKGEKLAAAKKTWDDLLGWGAQKADQVAWVAIWRAVKAEVAAANKGMDKTSEEFLELAAERFNEVINLTQVYDSTLVRSEYMRSKSFGAKMVTAFATEPTLTLNMLMDAAHSRDLKKIGRAAAVFIFGNIVTAAAAALAKAGRDDDESKPWIEKYLASIWDQLGGWSGSMNPLALFPVLRDIMSAFDGYDMERADMSVISDVIDEGGKWISGKYADDPMRGVENLTYAVCNLLGIPAKNVMQDVKSIINTVKGIMDPPRPVSGRMIAHDAKAGLTPNNLEVLIPWLDTSNAAYDRRAFNAMKRGDVEEVAAIRDFMRLQGRSDKSINTGVKNVVKEEVAEGRMTEAEAKKLMLANGLVKTEKDAFKTVDKWEEGSESYSPYNSMREAIDSGNIEAAEAEMDVLMANGWTEKEVRKEAREQANQAYMAGTLTKEQVRKLHKQDDWDENKWYWHFEELDFGKANGGDTSGWSQFGAFYEAVDTSKNLRGVAGNYLNHGVSKSTLKGRLRDNYRDEYRTLSKSNRREFANLRARLINALVAIGYPRDEAMKYLDSWLED